MSTLYVFEKEGSLFVQASDDEGETLALLKLHGQGDEFMVKVVFDAAVRAAIERAMQPLNL